MNSDVKERKNDQRTDWELELGIGIDYEYKRLKGGTFWRRGDRKRDERRQDSFSLILLTGDLGMRIMGEAGARDQDPIAG